jgi:uncharacterized protein (DUF39 family)
MFIVTLILVVFAFICGTKIQKAIILVKETRNIKYIEQVVSQVLNKDIDFKIVDFQSSKKEKKNIDDEDYKEFMKYKKLNEMYEKEC